MYSLAYRCKQQNIKLERRRSMIATAFPSCQSLPLYALSHWNGMSSEKGGGGIKVSKEGVRHPFEYVDILYLKIWGCGAD